MTKRVLILCTGNSCRSQMAEGLWNVLGTGDWEAVSAGSRPSGYVHPLAIEAMRQRELDISQGRSKSADEFTGQDFDLVVTVCDNARETCPVFPGARQTLHWPFDDPAEAVGTDAEKLPEFVRVRDEIEERISRYLSDTERQA
jgi:arsenate reductase (thioredoxin)